MSSLVQKYILSPKYVDADALQWYRKAFASFWSVQEVDLAGDDIHFDKLNLNEKKFIKQVLSFFAAADGIVAENCLVRFYSEFENTAVRFFYGFQTMMENVHNEMYSALIQAYVKDINEQEEMFMAVEESTFIAKKANWALKWLSSSQSRACRLFAFACVEGVYFSSSFCAIFWLKKRGLMPGLTFSNELISRDEGMHCEFACFLFNREEEKPDETEAYQTMDEVVAIESMFVKDALQVDLIGMNHTQMIQYVKFVADRLLDQCGYSKKYCVENPFDWMELISLQGKTNFFEKRVGEYQLPGVVAGSKGEFDLEEDF